MHSSNIKAGITSAYIIFALVTAGFVGLLVYEGIVDEGGVEGAAVHIVHSGGGGNYTKIQNAVDAASPGDIIYVWDGSYFENVVLNKKLTLLGNSSENTKINGQNIGDALKLTADWINISGFRLIAPSSPWTYYALSLSYANHSKIENCNVSLNKHSIRLYYSHNNILRNISSNQGQQTAVFLSESNGNIFENISCNSCSSGAYLYYSDNNIFRKLNCSFNKFYGMRLQYSVGNVIENCNVSSNYRDGIYIEKSLHNTVKNCTLYNNTNADIVSASSYSNVISNNSIFLGGINIYGDAVSQWNTHTIDTNNTVYGKPVYYYKNQTNINIPLDAGQVLLANCTKTEIDNFNLSRTSSGMVLGFCENITVKNCRFYKNKKDGILIYKSNYTKAVNNICNQNGVFGIYIYHSNNLLIKENNCSINNAGIMVSESRNSVFENNIFMQNINYGINFYWDIWYNRICNNTFIDNYNGISADLIFWNEIDNNTYKSNRRNGLIIDRSENNVISNSSFTDNIFNGLFFTTGSEKNKIYNNHVEKNGIGIEFSDQNNQIYHNNFIDNALQVRSSPGNIWNNPQSEGNFWSDYTGADDGSGGRTAGDGIGDTNLPHLTFDEYPFVRKSGWSYPPTPKLKDPGDMSSDGNYTVNWSNIVRKIGFVLEEDTNADFSSPTELYDGLNLNYTFTYKPNGTYYYRVKAYNEKYDGDYSNEESITVDWMPKSPKNLQVTEVTGDSITISWEKNTEADIQGYNVYMNEEGKGAQGPYKLIKSIASTENQFTVLNLQEETTYYFVVTAKDNVHETKYSNVASATVPDIDFPKPPSGFRANALNNFEIELTWNANTEADLEGYLLFMNDTGSDAVGSFHQIQKLGPAETDYTVTGLWEQTTYHFKILAFDNVPNNSTFSEVASATTPDIIPPATPTGLKIVKTTGDSISLEWNANTDYDLVGYQLFRSLGPTSKYGMVRTEPPTDLTYTDTGLNELTTYYYKLKAVDDVGLTSDFSFYVYGTTTHTPKPPVVEAPIEDFTMLEDSYDDTTINLLKVFSDINNDIMYFIVEGQEFFKVTIYNENGTVALQPQKNWNGYETLTFFATDDNITEVSEEVTITVVGVNDPPDRPKILVPELDAAFKEGIPVSFKGTCSDPDLPYGDNLEFVWYSDEEGKLGEGDNLSGIYLRPGDHVITLEVWDDEGESSRSETSIKVKEKRNGDNIEKPKVEQKEKESSMFAGIVIAFIVIIVIIILLFMLRIRKKKKEIEEAQQTAAAQVSLLPETQPGESAFQLPQEPTPQPPVQEYGSTEGPQVPPTTPTPVPEYGSAEVPEPQPPLPMTKPVPAEDEPTS
jgi:parallel beta-helix repeat protein